MPWLLVGPLVSLAVILSFWVWLSWRNQNSHLVNPGDAWKPSSHAAFGDFDPNGADAIPLNDYFPGVLVRLPNSTVPPIPLPTSASVLRFPLERVSSTRTPSASLARSPQSTIRPHLHLMKNSAPLVSAPLPPGSDQPSAPPFLLALLFLLAALPVALFFYAGLVAVNLIDRLRPHQSAKILLFPTSMVSPTRPRLVPPTK
jgi:hypothetical protein